MYKHILFDADNTLFDFDLAERNAFALTMRAFSVPGDEALFVRYREMNRKLWLDLEQGLVDRRVELVRRFERLLPGMDFSAADMNQEYQKNLVEQTVLMPYALELCQKLSGTAALSIVTNGVGTTQRRKMQRSAIAPFFSRHFISEEIGVAKPDLRFFEHVLDALENPPPSSVLIVGDSLTSDMQGGMNAGLVTCWLNRSGEPVPPGYRIDYEIGALDELEGILLGDQ
jgi:YjjG family noncanonical pyrimidine nucleotidase